MSFSMSVKEELARNISNPRHCQLAELSAIYSFCGTFVQKNGKFKQIFLNPENVLVANKCFTLLKKAFTISEDSENGENVVIYDREAMKIQLTGTELCDKINTALTSRVAVTHACCKRAYLRGAYLCTGSITNPEKSYHLEIVCKNKDNADLILSLFKDFDIDAKLAIRNKYYVVYIKDSSQIALALNVCDAPVCLMEFENTIILKDVRNKINRKNNCDTANISKTVSAAQQSISDIEMLMSSKEFDALPENLQEIARLRLENPEATLKELGEMATPPIGKSGVNHRLRKLSELAGTLLKN